VVAIGDAVAPPAGKRLESQNVTWRTFPTRVRGYIRGHAAPLLGDPAHSPAVKIAFAADHAGFPLRERVLAEVRALGHEAVDCGSPVPVAGDDYPDVALAVARAIVEGRAERGVLVCGSGVGACIAANKVPGIRACMCHDSFSARQGVEDDDMNVLCLGARVVGEELAAELVRAFLEARFSNAERHRRRVEKVEAMEGRVIR
jgi:ribose 5-phosphate isomerase B